MTAMIDPVSLLPNTLFAGQVPADRRPENRQPVASAMVGLREHANREMLALDLDATRRGSGAALELIADHAGPAAGIALRNRPGFGIVQCIEDVLFSDRLAIDIVEQAVPGLCHHRHDPRASPCRHRSSGSA